MRALLLVLLTAPAALCAGAAEKLRPVEPVAYSGMADASAAVAVSSNLFLVANDEDNILRLYSTERGGPPLREYDCNRVLELVGKFPETDLEGAARLGDRVFWISSHGNNKEGKDRPNRSRLFATDIQVKDGVLALTPVGRPYHTLLEDLMRDPRFMPFHLVRIPGRAPKDPGAVNIEGLAATPEGHLLIGFRNPIPAGKALVIPLLNPNEVIQGRSAQFGSPLQLDLGGLGIRDMAYDREHYLIIGGSYHGGGHFTLFRWTGGDAKPEPMNVKHLGRYKPEAIVIYPEGAPHHIQILSDDGTREISGIPGKAIRDARLKQFRAFWLGPKPVKEAK